MMLFSKPIVAAWMTAFAAVFLGSMTLAHAAEADRYLVQMQISAAGEVILAPRVVARMGQTAELEAGGSDGKSYRIDVSPKPASTGDSALAVLLELQVRQKQEASNEWALVASHRMMGQPSSTQPMQLSATFQTPDATQFQIDASLVPFAGNLDAGNQNPADNLRQHAATTATQTLSPY